VILLAIGVHAYHSARGLAENARWVAHTHEVLSNLSALYADILSVESARRAYLDAIAKRHLETIGRVSRHMGQLIDDLLAFSRIGQGAQVRTRVALGPLTREIIEALRPATGGRAVEWKVDGLPDVIGDRALLRIVFNNLLGNAVKYTRPRPRAVVEIGGATGSTGEIGVGFDMQYADKLFGVFQRLHRSEEFEGTGIGLATVRRIIRRHPGRTWAEASVDGGATFYVALPARAQENA
jgi:light-regulated signal transduction histidine kinase (bacteriophytochrome)